MLLEEASRKFDKWISDGVYRALTVTVSDLPACFVDRCAISPDEAPSIRAVSSWWPFLLPAGRIREIKYLSLRRRNSILLPDPVSDVRITLALNMTALFKSSERRMKPYPLVALVR